MNRLIEHLRVAVLREDRGTPDGRLLEAFVVEQSHAAFETLVQRHASMVWGVCRRMLGNQQDAEDAFQASFLVLVKKAGSLEEKEIVGNWLYGVAQQTAVRMRALAAKRGWRERQVVAMPEKTEAHAEHWDDIKPIIDEGLARLADKYRAVVVLCDLEGKSRREAAQIIGVPEGTVASRLTTARTKLAKYLKQRGVVLSALAIGSFLAQQASAAPVPVGVCKSILKAAVDVAAGNLARVPSANVETLIEGVLQAMIVTKVKKAFAILLAVSLMLAGIGASTGLFHGSHAMAQNEAEPKDADKKQPASAAKYGELIRLGQKREEIVAAFGMPEKSVILASGIESMQYQQDPLRILVEISPKSKRAIQVYYFKQTPFTKLEILLLLDRNAEGSEWAPEVGGEGSRFYRKDGAMARSGTPGGEFMFAVLTASEVRR